MLLEETEKERLRFTLERAVRSGARLYLEGKQSTPEAIVRCCVNEEMSYMPDYVLNDRGKLTEVRYDKIRFYDREK